jgi:citrate synthase
MGMGHAVYKTGDPRAMILKAMCRSLGEKLGQLKWLHLLERIEKTAMDEFEARGKTGIMPNIDFYSAPVYYMIGLPTDLFTPVFAISRMAGWCAHMLEEKFALAQSKPALYRPSAEYIGNYCGLMGCGYKQMEER